MAETKPSVSARNQKSIQEQIQKATTESNVLELRRIFGSLSETQRLQYLNETWTEDGQTFLHLCSSRDLDLGKYLLCIGADPNVFDMNDNTPLHLACEKKRKAFIRLLIRENARFDIANLNGKLCYEMAPASSEHREKKEKDKKEKRKEAKDENALSDEALELKGFIEEMKEKFKDWDKHNKKLFPKPSYAQNTGDDDHADVTGDRQTGEDLTGTMHDFKEKIIKKLEDDTLLQDLFQMLFEYFPVLYDECMPQLLPSDGTQSNDENKDVKMGEEEKREIILSEINRWLEDFSRINNTNAPKLQQTKPKSLLYDMNNPQSSPNSSTKPKYDAKEVLGGIVKLEQLTLLSFENWLIDMKLPHIMEYLLELVCDLYIENSMIEIQNLNDESTIHDILLISNKKLKNKYNEKEMKKFEEMFYIQEIHLLQQLLHLNMRSWQMLDIPVDLSNMVRKLINWYSMTLNITSAQNAYSETEHLSRHGAGFGAEDKEREILFQIPLSNASTIESAPDITGNVPNMHAMITCIHNSEHFIHIGTNEGIVYAWDTRNRKAFHQFALDVPTSLLSSSDDNTDEMRKSANICPMFMEFLGKEKNEYDKCIIADDQGCISCWCLHSKHPRLRGKCLRYWKSHDGPISGFGIPPNSKSIISIGYDGYLKVRDLEYNGALVLSIEISPNVGLTSLWILSKNEVLVGTEDGKIMTINIQTKSVPNMVDLLFSYPIRNLCVQPDASKCFFTFNSNYIGVLDLETFTYMGEFIHAFGSHTKCINHLHIQNASSDEEKEESGSNGLSGALLYSCSEDLTVRIWDLTFTFSDTSSKKKQSGTDMPKFVLKICDNSPSVPANAAGSAVANGNDAPKYLEVWELLQILVGKDSIDQFIFNSGYLICCGFSQLIGFDLEKIHQVIVTKKELIHARRQQLVENEKSLESQSAGGEKKSDKKGKAKKGKKKK